jgi:hypothetical protein
MAVPYTFGSATTSIPLSQLDSNFATTITLGNTAIQLGNTVTTLNNMTLANVTISSGTSNLASTSISNGTSNVTVNSSGGNITLGTAGTTAVTIDTSQNVGIGVTPSTGTGWANNLEMLSTSNIVNQGTDFSVGTNWYYNSGYKYKTTAAVTNIYQKSGTIQFQYAASGTAGSALTFSESMRINSSGNLCVGTTSNIARIGAVFDGSTDNGCVLRTSTNASGTTFLFFQQDTNTCGVVTRVGTTSAVTYGTTSDYRLKENVTPMTGALSKVARLKPVTYTWKSGGESAEGFIAHELAEVCPDAVVGKKDETQEQEYEVTPEVKDEEGNITTPAVMGTRTVPKYQSIDTSFLVATLTAAIQELSAKNDALTARIVALESK